jgi:bifunctional DNase/RNase
MSDAAAETTDATELTDSPDPETPVVAEMSEPEMVPEPEAPAEPEMVPEPEAPAEPLGFELPTPMSRMMFVDIVLVLPSTHPVVVLQESDLPYRELRIPIGGPEGIAIGYAARQVATPRPLTHELMTQLLEKFSLTLDVVRITGLTGGMFTAEIVVSGPSGSRTIDCRPSDAVALALRQRLPVPIMADPDVLDRAAGGAAGAN